MHRRFPVFFAAALLLVSTGFVVLADGNANHRGSDNNVFGALSNAEQHDSPYASSASSDMERILKPKGMKTMKVKSPKKSKAKASKKAKSKAKSSKKVKASKSKTPEPTPAPTAAAITTSPTTSPTASPTTSPTASPTTSPTASPTTSPSAGPTFPAGTPSVEAEASVVCAPGECTTESLGSSFEDAANDVSSRRRSLSITHGDSENDSKPRQLDSDTVVQVKEVTQVDCSTLTPVPFPPAECYTIVYEVFGDDLADVEESLSEIELAVANGDITSAMEEELGIEILVQLPPTDPPTDPPTVGTPNPSEEPTYFPTATFEPTVQPTDTLSPTGSISPTELPQRRDLSAGATIPFRRQLKPDLEYVCTNETLKALKEELPILNSHWETTRNLSIDVVSIGHTARQNYMEGQAVTWGAHGSVRNFWGFTERQDFDPDCSSMGNDDLVAHIDTCTSDLGWEDREVDRFVRHFYTKTEGRRFRTDAGWICAQRRHGRALGWLDHVYSAQAQSGDLPDFLLIVDDDTFFDIDYFVSYAKIHDLLECNKPQAIAGCMIFENDMIAWALPYGGFGTVFNKKSLEMLVKPIHCLGKDTDILMDGVCSSLERNRIGEASLFEEGMSIFDLFYRYSAIRNYCMHSDWLLGYIVKFYLSSSPEPLTWDKGLQAKNLPLWGMAAFEATCGNYSSTGDVRLCEDDPHLCHNQTPHDMESFAMLSYSQSPLNYRSIPALGENHFQNQATQEE